VHQLPPLILHPFADRTGPSKLLDSSKAHLALRGMTTEEAYRTSSDLVETFLEGRYTEIRMLFYVGRDVCRWIQQCLEQSERQQSTRHLGLTFESFADYLVNRPPSPVKEKLQFWGVLDFRSIFIRAIGLNSMFEECPDRGLLAAGFIREYHRFADSLYKCRLGDADFTRVDPDQFDFQLFASGEYAKMLEQQWG
jgi:hypothetical protein